MSRIFSVPVKTERTGEECQLARQVSTNDAASESVMQADCNVHNDANDVMTTIDRKAASVQLQSSLFDNYSLI